MRDPLHTYHRHSGPDHAVGAHTGMPQAEFRRIDRPSEHLKPGRADILGAIKAMRGRRIFADEAGDPAFQPVKNGASKVDLIRARQADVEVRNVRLEPGQKVDIEAMTDGNFTMTDVWVTR